MTNGKSSSDKPLRANWHGIDTTYHPEVAKAVRAVVDWHNDPDAIGLVLAGNTGCAKTSMANVVITASGGPYISLNENLESVENAIFRAENELLDDIRETYSGGKTKNVGHGIASRGIITRCAKAKLLVIDDLGVGYIKDGSERWYQDVMWKLFDPRATNKLKMLITTNLDPIAFRERIGQRAWSRLQQMTGDSDRFVTMFNVPDYRGKDWVK